MSIIFWLGEGVGLCCLPISLVERRVLQEKARLHFEFKLYLNGCFYD